MSENTFYTNNNQENFSDKSEVDLESYEVDVQGFNNVLDSTETVEELTVAEENNVISFENELDPDLPKMASMESDKSGIVTSAKTKEPAASKTKKTETKKETVAIFSTRNVTWSEVGKVYRGYNIVSKEAADKWLTRDHIRLATPQEIAEEFNR